MPGQWVWTTSRSPPECSDRNVDWYLLHARLCAIDEPYIWRQLLVPSTLPLSKLHVVMQAAFGWANCHMHSFNVRPVEDVIIDDETLPPIKTKRNPGGFSVPNMAMGYDRVFSAFRDKEEMDMHKEMFSDEGEMALETKTTIGKLVKKYNLASNKKNALMYEYDHGDGWEHVIMVEKVLPPAEVKEVVGKGEDMITAGLGHEVAEDCGGVSGWEDLKHAYKVKGTRKDDDDSAELRDWYEETCANGDERGLKGKGKLERFSVQEANGNFHVLSGMYS